MSASSLGHDDYALRRVPEDARYHWFSVAIQRFGQLSSLASFLLGATLGFGMEFWDAVLAITLGAVILEIVTIFTGIAGQREGLSTSVLARWTGFGTAGSTLIGLAIGGQRRRLVRHPERGVRAGARQPPSACCRRGCGRLFSGLPSR